MEKRLIFTLVVGEEFRNIFALLGPAMRRYAEFCHADFRVVTETNPMYGYWDGFGDALDDGYEDVLFLDADVLVQPHAPDVFAEVRHSGIAMRRSPPLTTEVLFQKHRFDFPPPRFQFNSGVILTDAEFLRRLVPVLRTLPRPLGEQLFFSHVLDKLLDHEPTELANAWNCMQNTRMPGEECFFLHLNSPRQGKADRIRRYLEMGDWEHDPAQWVLRPPADHAAAPRDDVV